VRAVVQRVSEAHVAVGDEVVGRIGRGMLVLLGVGQDDGERQADFLAGKIAGLRVFDDDAGKLNRSLGDVGGEVLVVSQFTLWGDCRAGRRPSYSRAAPGERAEALYRRFIAALGSAGIAVAEGRFGARMQVHLVNDGPVTLLLDSEGAF
jgi:D-tyrosyl-tRNA(Tyr) deacylase